MSKVPSIEDLPLASAAACYDAGMQAARFLAELAPAGAPASATGSMLDAAGSLVPPARILRAFRYRNAALALWAASLPTGLAVSPPPADPGAVINIESHHDRAIAYAVALAVADEGEDLDL